MQYQNKALASRLQTSEKEVKSLKMQVQKQESDISLWQDTFATFTASLNSVRTTLFSSEQV